MQFFKLRIGIDLYICNNWSVLDCSWKEILNIALTFFRAIQKCSYSMGKTQYLNIKFKYYAQKRKGNKMMVI